MIRGDRLELWLTPTGIEGEAGDGSGKKGGNRLLLTLLCGIIGVVCLWGSWKFATGGEAGGLFGAFIVGVGGLLTLVSALFLALSHRRIIIDRRAKVFVSETFFGPPVKRKTHSIDDVVAVSVKRAIAPNNTEHTVGLERENGETIEFYYAAGDAPGAKKCAEIVADFLGLSIVYKKLTEVEAKKNYKATARILGGFAAFILVFLVVFTVFKTLPLVRDAIVMSRYDEESLVEVPCRILSMELHESDTEYTADLDNHATVHVTQGTWVDVKFTYTFEGEQYESAKYSPLGATVLDDFEPFEPGHETVCYLNPKWPDEAVLTAEWYLDQVFYVVMVTFAFLFFLFIVAGLRRHFKNVYLKHRGWIEEDDDEIIAEGERVPD